MNFFSPKKKKPDPAKSQLNSLIEATCNGWTTAVINLVESGIDLNAKTETGITALHIAAQLGNNAIVKALIKLGADVNCRESNYLSTPLHFAAMKSKVITMQDLIKVKNAIADRGCNINGEMILPEDMKYSIESYEAVIVTLARKGADLNARDLHGKTPLHLAIHYRSNSVKTLLGLGADVDAQDNKGRLPWHYAVQHDNYEGLRWLLAFGADINDFNMFREGELDDIKFMFTYSKSSMKYLMYDQITRLRAANLFISRVYPLCDRIASSQSYYNKCVEEVKKMENYEIEDGVSLYDLLHMSPKRKAAYTKPSDRIKDMLIEFESQFPQYYGIIRANFFAENKRKRMLKDAVSAWYTLTKIDLPDICVEHILSYLDACYLNIMIDGAKYCQDSK